jgi:hypothetical protein
MASVGPAAEAPEPPDLGVSRDEPQVSRSEAKAVTRLAVVEALSPDTAVAESLAAGRESDQWDEEANGQLLQWNFVGAIAPQKFH